jgi:hypothetical protein
MMTDVQASGLTTGAYRSYLVRFWQSNEQGCWRASALCVQTGAPQLFGDVGSLYLFLESELENKPPTGASTHDTPPSQSG